MRYRDILQQEIKEELERLEQVFEYYSEIEARIPEDLSWTVLSSVHAPGILHDLLPAERVLGSEAIRRRMDLLSGATDYAADLEGLLERVQVAYAYEKALEDKNPDDEQWKVLKPHSYPSVPNYKLTSSSELLQREAEKITALIEELRPSTFYQKLVSYVTSFFSDDPIRNARDYLLNSS